MEPRRAVNGHGAQTNGNAAKLRVPTVNEALRFTPFASIVPFTSEVIPPPLAYPSSSSTIYSTSEEKFSANKTLEELSSRASTAERASKRFQKTVQDVQQFLSPESLTQFRFKRRGQMSERLDTTKIPSSAPPLSAFAKIVLDSTDIEFRYVPSGPERSNNNLPSFSNKAKERAPQSRTAPPKTVSHNQSAALQNVYVTPHQSGSLPIARITELRAVVVPSVLTPAQRAEYQVVPQSDAMAGADTSPSKRPVAVPRTQTMSVDQRQKSNAAVQSLQNLLSDIFEEEDMLEPANSDNSKSHALSYFSPDNGEDSSSPTLRPDTHIRLESAIQKVNTLNRFDSISVKQLARVQRLCENAVGRVEALSLSLGDEWVEQDVEDWASRLRTAENGLHACKALLRIMTAGREEKELYSEEFLKTILTAIKNITDMCLIPVIGERSMRSKEKPNEKFVVAHSKQTELSALLNATTRTVRLIGDLLVKTVVDESSVTSMEFLCKNLIFAENVSSERDAALGIQTFEPLRKCAMNVLAQIFARYESQRRFIFDEILDSLEKLPATRQSARQFKLIDGKPIQLVSALLMRLVQTSATQARTTLKSKSKVSARLSGGAVSDSSADEEDDEFPEEESDEDDSQVSPTDMRAPPESLAYLSKPLRAAAQENASYIIRVLVARGLTTSKTSDEPYRKLLDIFTEDFLSVLGSSDWPSSELLLSILCSHMVTIAEDSKSTAPAKNLALELLSMMGTGILELQLNARKLARTLDTTESDVSSRLVQVFDEVESNELDEDALTAFNGVYRVVIEYIQARDIDDAHLPTARGFTLTQWASRLGSLRKGAAGEDEKDLPYASKELHRTVRSMIVDPHWLEDHSDFETVTTAQGRLAAFLIALSSHFCRAFGRVFNILLNAMSSDQTTVRSKSLKSVVTLLETDPSVLDRNHHVMKNIFRCSEDSSPMVRDSALSLISKCLSLRPELYGKVYEHVIKRTRDTAIGVRKRAIKLVKEMFLRNQSIDLRSALGNAVLEHIDDSDEGVAELAQSTMEEVWLTPLHYLKASSEDTLQTKLRYRGQALLLIRTALLGDVAINMMESLFKQMLGSASKNLTANLRVSKELVIVMFDGIIDNTDLPETPSQDSILNTLTVFAKASPGLFASNQLERLEPYITNLSREDERQMFRSVVVILRHVMPRLPNLKETFLQQIQKGLLLSVQKLHKTELAEVAPCLWTVNSILKDPIKLVKLMTSVVKNLRSLQQEPLADDPRKLGITSKTLVIAGHFGKACNFGPEHLPAFEEQIPWWKGDTVASLVVDVMCNFTSPKQPQSIRETALESICLVCQAWPSQFLRVDVANAFEVIFADRVPSLEQVLLSGLEGFFCADEALQDQSDNIAIGGGVTTGTERLGNTYLATDHDGASTLIAQRFLQQIIRLALASCDELALTATKIIASVSRQGLVHPKECGPTLVALETCPAIEIASLAFQEHRVLHNKHETMFSKEYMRSVQRAFDYQRDVIGDIRGFTGVPPVAKMHLTWEVLKTGNAKVRKNFLGSLCQRLDFDPAKLDVARDIPTHLAFVHYCTENLAFFEYGRIDDLLHLISGLEKIFAATGTSVAQAIETDIKKNTVETTSTQDAAQNPTSETMIADSDDRDVDPARLRHLAVCSQALYLIWETLKHLRATWNLQSVQKQTAKAKAKPAAKDNNKAPNRAANAPSLTERYIKRVDTVMSALSTPDSQHAICLAFADLITTDTDVKVGSDNDEDADVNGSDTASESTSTKSASVPPGGSGRGRKRKAGSVANTPRKKRAGSKRPSMGRRTSSSKTKYMHEDEDADGDDD